MHTLDFFSQQGDQIELIPFALCQASRVPTTYNLKNFEFPIFWGLTPLGGPSKIFFGENQNFPSVLRSIGHHIRCLLYKFEHIVAI